jgi:hypothetical protein
VYVAAYIVYILPEYMFEHGNLSYWSLLEANLQIQNYSYPNMNRILLKFILYTVFQKNLNDLNLVYFTY